jgi:hypothetical protein
MFGLVLFLLALWIVVTVALGITELLLHFAFFIILAGVATFIVNTSREV